MWMYDCLSQYLSSPLWRIPIVDFLETNCIYFEDTEENKFEYTKIFDVSCKIKTELPTIGQQYGR